MIYVKKNLFVLETAHTAYVFDVMEGGLMRHIYYGCRMPYRQDYASLAPTMISPPVNSTADLYHAGREDVMQEAGTAGWGDLREPLVKLLLPEGGLACDFQYSSWELAKDASPEGMPCAQGGETLKVILRERSRPIYLELYYTVYEDTDAIGHWTRLVNKTEQTVWVDRLMSQQLELPVGDYVLTTFRGAWAREMKPMRQDLQGELRWSSRAGVSSNRCNPFAMVSHHGTDEDSGAVWGFNLLYSGNHLGIAECNAYGRIRVLQGMGEMHWQLDAGQLLDTPQGVMAFSTAGYNGLSQCMHPFVQNHIVRGYWQNRERPVLLNSWEAVYFDINHEKMAEMAKRAKDIGAELLVMDDGWFKNRDDDTRALGDWTPDERKLPRGLSALAEDVNAQGVAFGLWVEPEMVSENSDLYREHPDWILGHKEQAIGRNQYVLDLSRPEVCRHIIEQMTALLESADISYIKWDMNRILTDTFSATLPSARQDETAHRYVLGLYGILKELTEKFPKVLFESCASGGNRFDLGILCYMPQIWTSDNTDAACRSDIQWGCSYGYPQSVMGCHVSACPNHQTLRTAPLESRFQVAATGLLGYELDPGKMSEDEKAAVRAQIRFYKERRRLFQFGRLYRCAAPTGERLTMVVSQDGTEAAGVHFVRQADANPAHAPLYARGLLKDRHYHLHTIFQQADGEDVNLSMPNLFANELQDQLELTASGAAFCKGGFYPVQPFGSTGWVRGAHMTRDFDSRLYLWN